MIKERIEQEFKRIQEIATKKGSINEEDIIYKLMKYEATADEIMLLLVGIVVSFLVSLAVIKFLMDFVKKHSFTAFGIYRIALGIIVLLYFGIKVFAA